MANTWGQSGTTWGQNQWGDQADVDVSITAPTQLSKHSVPLYLSMN